MMKNHCPDAYLLTKIQKNKFFVNVTVLTIFRAFTLNNSQSLLAFICYFIANISAYFPFGFLIVPCSTSAPLKYA